MKSLFEVTSYYSLSEYGLKYYPTGQYVGHLPKTPSNRVKLYRIGVKLTRYIHVLRCVGFVSLPPLPPGVQLSNVASLDFRGFL